MLSFLFSFNAHAQPPLPSSTQEYARLLKTAQQKKTSLEPVLAYGEKTIQELADPLSCDPEALDQKWLAELKNRMKGFAINPNTETVVAYPDFEFFLKTAKAAGNKPDIAFFELKKQTYSESSWPIYIEQQTDLGGCTRFDGTITRLYRGWLAFQKSHPHSFTAAAKDEITRLLDALNGTCACNDKPDHVLSELESFVRDFPDSAINDSLRSRIVRLKKGPSDLRLSCIGGA